MRDRSEYHWEFVDKGKGSYAAKKRRYIFKKKNFRNTYTRTPTQATRTLWRQPSRILHSDSRPASPLQRDDSRTHSAEESVSPCHRQRKDSTEYGIRAREKPEGVVLSIWAILVVCFSLPLLSQPPDPMRKSQERPCWESLSSRYSLLAFPPVINEYKIVLSNSSKIETCFASDQPFADNPKQTNHEKKKNLTI